MKQIKWFEKYGLGTIDILESDNSTGRTRYKISRKLFQEISHIITNKKVQREVDWYYNPRVADKGKSVTFALDTKYGIEAIFEDPRICNSRTLKTNLSLFSKYIYSKYK